MDHVEKPPSGIMPRNIWQDKVSRERIAALLDAMERFTRSSRAVPEEWIAELRELIGAQPSDPAGGE